MGSSPWLQSKCRHLEKEQVNRTRYDLIIFWHVLSRVKMTQLFVMFIGM